MRAGIGFDVHPWKEGRKLVLGGVEIPYERGLYGHSDADVLIHAIIDAILGAFGMEDIGTLFPETDEYKGISSMELLKRVRERIPGRVVNVDAVLVLEEPVIRPYKERMRENIARVLGMDKERISIKGKRCEGLGFVGRKEGAAAMAVVLVEAV
ncbi:2-C-methyl-D-erythritol 2,4-cyclodiphosphate synthase [bacterium]|nr:MAG: 2-C-methyl-D-erythritol 2,4-cyclodiphosphate synthase [bacterium]